MSAADAQAIVPAALFCFSLAQNMQDKLTTYAFCYEDSYRRGNPMAALGVRGYDVRIIHIRDAAARDFIRQRGGLVIPKLDGYRRADEVKDLVGMWVREFGERIPFIKLPDEPTANNISVEQMVEMARAIREVTDIPIEVNLMADGANIVYALALAPYIKILSTDAYCNATPECNVNTMQTVRVAMIWLVDVFKAAGMSAEKGQGIGFIAQGFRMTRCRAELQARSVEFGDPMFEMVFAALKEIIGDLLRVLGIYAWLDVDKPGTDGDMPSLHEDMWPPIRRFTARLDGYYEPAHPQPLPAGGEKARFEPSTVSAGVGGVAPVRVIVPDGRAIARFVIEPQDLIDGWPAELPPGATVWSVNGRKPGKGAITCVLDDGTESELEFEVRGAARAPRKFTATFTFDDGQVMNVAGEEVIA